MSHQTATSRKGIAVMKPGRSEIIILLVWGLINTFFLVRRGIFMEGESAKYIAQAHLFVRTGHLESSNFWFYFLQIALLSACIWLKISFAFVAILQLIVNLIATRCFYKTILYLFRDPGTALAGTLMLLANLPYQEFNTFLQTESFFYSLTVILGCYLVRIEKPTVKNLVVLTGLLLILCITRPTGLLFLPPACLYLFLIFVRKMSVAGKILVFISIGSGFFLLLNAALGSGGELDFMLPFRNEQIICGVPTSTTFVPIRAAANGNSIYGLAYYIFHNPGQFFRLAGLRTLAFFGLCREYYHTGHNAWLVVYFYSIHIMALAAIPRWLKKNSYIFVCLLTIILLNWFTVILTCDDWHNRFYLTISPFLLILSIPVWQKFFAKKESARH